LGTFLIQVNRLFSRKLCVMADHFFINYKGRDIKVTPVQGGQDLYYMIEFPEGTKMLEFQLENDIAVGAFTEEGITDESKQIALLIEKKEA
jgi:hypothetical protein